jgi:hypothetical protein
MAFNGRFGMHFNVFSITKAGVQPSSPTLKHVLEHQTPDQVFKKANDKKGFPIIAPSEAGGKLAFRFNPRQRFAYTANLQYVIAPTTTTQRKSHCDLIQSPHFLPTTATSTSSPAGYTTT